MGRTRRIRVKHVQEIEGCGWADSDSSDSGSDHDGRQRRRRRPVTYLAYFAQSLLDFRRAEFEALAELSGGCPRGAVEWGAPRDGDPESPYWFVTLPSRRVARFVAERAVLLRALVEVWGEGRDWAALRARVEDALSDERAPDGAEAAARRRRWLAPEVSFRVKTDTWGFRLDDAARRAVFDALAFVPFQGRVDLSARAGASFWAIFVGARPDVERRHTGGGGGGGGGGGSDAGAGDDAAAAAAAGTATAAANGGEKEGEQQPPEQPQQQHWRYAYFGREVAVAASRCLPSLFTLKARRYLGPTSMDAEVAFVMANLAWARPGTLALDPYCGTGSVLVAAARLGATVVGGDIDMRVLKLGNANKKTGAAVDNFSNFEQYGLPWPAGLVRMDASRPPFRRGLEGAFDLIVGDPPYGVRAGGRKSRRDDAVEVRDPTAHFASTAPYGLTECVDDLVALAAQLLREGECLGFLRVKGGR